MKPAKPIFKFKTGQKVSFQSKADPNQCGVGYVSQRSVQGGKNVYYIRKDYNDKKSLVTTAAHSVLGGLVRPIVTPFTEDELRRISDDHPDLRQRSLDL
ncbi:hypothetical protein [Providencia phage Kokobel2]|nr:hypothetical protein [Providencia phage Kokobel2]